MNQSTTWLWPSPAAHKRVIHQLDSRKYYKGELVSVEEAARRIGVSSGRLRRIMHKYCCGLDEAADLINKMFVIRK